MRQSHVGIHEYEGGTVSRAGDSDFHTMEYGPFGDEDLDKRKIDEFFQKKAGIDEETIEDLSEFQMGFHINWPATEAGPWPGAPSMNCPSVS